MNYYLGALVGVVTPFLIFLTPGITALPIHHHKHVGKWGAKVVLGSVVMWILTTTAVSALGLSVWWAIAGMLATTLFFGIRTYKDFLSLPHYWYVAALITPLVLGFALFAIPLLNIQDGLPAGDAEKAILFANDILQTNHLPNYQAAISKLNRDPVDFYTPGLHAVVAAVMRMSPVPLLSVSFFSILVALSVVVIACAMGKDLFDTPGKLFPTIFIALFILGNIRFLRYLRQPGYHVQNSLGELLLFGLLMLALSLIHRWHTKNALLAVGTIIALIISHQFSTFIAVFALLPVFSMFLISRRHVFFHALRTKRLLLSACAIAILVMIGAGMALGLQEKIPHLFTTHPHLTDELPSLIDYADLLGPIILIMGIGGLILFAVHSSNHHPHYREGIAFLLATIGILCLSQGPRLFIDIPPVRALFYAVVPLSICAAYLVSQTIHYLWMKKTYPALSTAVLSIILLIGAIFNIHLALASVDHAVRTDSSLDPELVSLASMLQGKEGAIVIDDYNRRSSSWLTLSGLPVFSRLASEGTRQQAEASQSALRNRLFLNQLDIEKMYALGNWSGITTLFQKHEVAYIVGSMNASTNNFIHNPNLEISAWAGDLTVFHVKNANDNKEESSLANWLVKPSTLANDIGDDEDTFDHLPASLVAPRLSPAQFDGKQTYRVSRAPIITARFNEGDYVASLWNKDGDTTPDTALELYIRFASSVANLNLKIGDAITPITTQENLVVRIEKNEIPPSSNGFIDISILNPYEEPIAIDMIALGLAQTP